MGLFRRMRRAIAPGSAYAEAVRCLYEHPLEGAGVFRVSPDTSRKAKEQEHIRPRSKDEAPFMAIWTAAPAHLKGWAVGRLSVHAPELAAEIEPEVPAAEVWHLRTLGRRGRYLVADVETGELVDPHTAEPLPDVTTDRAGNVVHADSGERVDMG